jgi:acylphosphatase
MKKVHINIKITGKVQGKGFIRNEADGSVYLEAEGEQWELDSFLEWCNDGPDRAKVEECVVSEGEGKDFKDFVVLKK